MGACEYIHHIKNGNRSLISYSFYKCGRKLDNRLQISQNLVKDYL